VKDGVNDTVEPVSDWQDLILVDSAMVSVFEHRISGLSPKTSYEIEITACNIIGWSEANEQSIFTTSGSKYIRKCVMSCVLSLASRVSVCGQELCDWWSWIFLQANSLS